MNSTYENNEDVEDATVVAGTEPTTAEIATAVQTVFNESLANTDSNGVNDLISASGSGLGDVKATQSDALNQAIIDEQKSIFSKAVDTAQAKVDKVAGLDAAVGVLAAAQEELGEAIAAQEDTAADAVGAIAAFDTANSETLVVEYGSVTAGEYTPGTSVDVANLAKDDVVVNGGTDPVITVNAKGELVLAAAYKDSPKAAQLLAAVKADVASIQGLVNATGDLSAAIAEVLVLEGLDEIDGTETTTSADSGTTAAVTIATAELVVDKAGNLFVRDSAASGGVENNLYSVTDLTVSLTDADPTVASVAVKFNSDGGADATYAAADYTAVSATAPYAITSDEVDASAFIDASTAPEYVTTSFAGNAADSSELVGALNSQSAFDEAVESYVEANALVQELKQLDEAVTTARDYITSEDGLDINLLEGAQNFTIGDDLYLFNAEDSDGVSLAKFGASGFDSIFFGQGFTLVELGDKQITDNVGDVNAMEIFWEQVGTSVKLYVETESFGGNTAGQEEIVELTLTGVQGGDINNDLANGFLTAGEVMA